MAGKYIQAISAACKRARGIHRSARSAATRNYGIEALQSRTEIREKEFVRFERKPETSWALEIGDINDTKNPPKGVQYSRHSLVELDAEVNYGLLQAPIVARV